jgi:hypothetical protein
MRLLIWCLILLGRAGCGNLNTAVSRIALAFVTRVTGFFTSVDRLPIEDVTQAKSTAHDYLEPRNWDGTLERIHHELYVAVRASRKAGS